MSLEILVPKGFSRTPPLLKAKLQERGVQEVFCKYTFKESDRAPSPVTARVCWGIKGTRSQVPTLNLHAGSISKIQELQALTSHGVPCPQFWQGRVPARESLYPIIGRSGTTHAAGEGIRVFANPQAAMAHPCDVYTRVIPSDSEFRVWVFRTKHLASYKRVQCWPVKREGFGRNWWNGWGYRLHEEMSRDAIEHAKIALAALDLDFGAVDILKGQDGRFYVLEVNTAPGATLGGGAVFCQRALGKLADEIKGWYQGLEDQEVDEW